ncbi:MAG: hypothetical protein OCD03_16155 [Hyphomicrobiales bacterium]
MEKQKYWYLGFLGFIGFYFIPHMANVILNAEGSYWDLTHALWFLWFLDFLPVKKHSTEST